MPKRVKTGLRPKCSVKRVRLPIDPTDLPSPLIPPLVVLKRLAFIASLLDAPKPYYQSARFLAVLRS